jgi:WD40 repeat protein
LGSAAGLHEVTLAPPYQKRDIEVVREQNRWSVPVVAVRNGMVIEVRSKAKAIASVPLDAPTHTVVRSVEGGNGVFAIAEQNRLIVIAANRGINDGKPDHIWLYDLNLPNAPPSLLASGRAYQPMISQDGRYLAINFNSKLTLFDLDKLEKRWAVASLSNGLAAVGFAPGNRWLFVGDGKGDRIILDVETGRERWREPTYGRNGAWHSAASSQLGLFVVAREADRLELLDLDLQHVAFLGYPHQYGWTSVPSALATSPDGKWAAIAYNGRVHLWDLASREPTYLIDPRIKKR